VAVATSRHNWIKNVSGCQKLFVRLSQFASALPHPTPSGRRCSCECTACVYIYIFMCVPAMIIPNWCSPARRSRRAHKAPEPLSSIIIIITIIVIIIIVIRGVHIRVYDFCAEPYFYDGRSELVYNTPPWTGKNNNNWPESRKSSRGRVCGDGGGDIYTYAASTPL